MKFVALVILPLLAACVGKAAINFERLVDPAEAADAAYRIDGKGFISDSGHPERPLQFRRHEINLRLSVHPGPGDFAFEIESGTAEEREFDRYYVRRGRIFQVGDDGVEIDASPLLDLRPATLAALHPLIVANAMRERRDMVQTDKGGALRFAWNDEFWTAGVESGTGRITGLSRRFYDDLLGDGVESITYSHRPDGAGALSGVVVTSRGREIARVNFAAGISAATLSVPDGDRERDRAVVIAPEEFKLAPVAPHLFTLELPSINSRVMVAEFNDHLVVLEGVYNSRNGDRLAAALRRQLDKPVRYFAFSHLHGQYIGGARSWIHAGATILVPPTTVPLIEAMAQGRHELRPDALALNPQPPKWERVEGKRRLEDQTNVLDIYNIESGHTDEYLIFHFPRQKIMLAGDLIGYRPGKPPGARTKKLCVALERLQLEVDKFYVTWPLDNRYGTTQNVVSGEELRALCAPISPPSPPTP